MNQGKQHIIILSFLIVSLNAFSQDKMAWNNNSIGYVQVTTITSPYCGSVDDVVLKLRNTRSKNVDVKWWYKRNNGQWSDSRQIDDMIPNKVYEVGACNYSREFIMYVRESGSDQRFPTTQEVLKDKY